MDKKDIETTPLYQILDRICDIDKRIDDLNKDIKDLKEYEEFLIDEIERRFPGYRKLLEESEKEMK